jgi:hypothetical protein
MTRRPRAEDLDNATAWVQFQTRQGVPAEQVAAVLLAVVVAVLCTLALVHWASPCAIDGALCAAPLLVLPPRWQRLAARAYRRLHMRVLRARLAQLQGAALQLTLDAAHHDRQPPAHLGGLLDRAAQARQQLRRLQQVDDLDRAADRLAQRLQARP